MESGGVAKRVAERKRPTYKGSLGLGQSARGGRSEGHEDHENFEGWPLYDGRWTSSLLRKRRRKLSQKRKEGENEERKTLTVSNQCLTVKPQI